MSTSGMIASGSQASFSAISKLSPKRTFLQPLSSFSPITHSKSIRTSPIKASSATAVDNVYVNTQNFYDLLGTSESGTLSDIKKAYKQLARKYHPDVSPPGCTEEYTKMFLQVQEAYETLSDPESRALYDRDIAGGLNLHMIFSNRKRSHFNEGVDDDRSGWQQRWQSQLGELTRMSNHRDMESMSWGAKMRSQRSCRN